MGEELGGGEGNSKYLQGIEAAEPGKGIRFHFCYRIFAEVESKQSGDMGKGAVVEAGQQILLKSAEAEGIEGTHLTRNTYSSIVFGGRRCGTLRKRRSWQSTTTAAGPASVQVQPAGHPKNVRV